MATLYTTKYTTKYTNGNAMEDNAPTPDTTQCQVVSLTYNERQRNRLAVMLPSGQAVAIVLPRGQCLHQGDVLMAEDGQLLRIEAQPESLMAIRCSSPFELMRVVYHLANRHVRAMLTEAVIYIEPDPVLADLISKLGGTVQTVSEVFEPESGAYAGGHHHGPVDAIDQSMGNIGEQLSIAAHSGNQHHER